MKRVRVVAHGRVQGVFFRDTVAGRAAEMDVAGWIRNRPDGTVEAVFEGAAEAVDALVDLCRHGPATARVEDLEIAEEPPAGESGFGVR